MKYSILVLLTLVIQSQLHPQQFLSGGIVRYDAVQNKLTKEADLALVTGSLVQADNGLFYGLEQYNNSNPALNIFSFNPLTKEYKIEYVIPDGAAGFFISGMIKGSDGLLYGQTFDNGKYNKGYIFSFDPVMRTFQIRYEYTSEDPFKYTDCQLTEVARGVFYSIGDKLPNGVIYSVDLNSGVLNILHDFSYNEGSFGVGQLIKGDDGLFYGMRYYDIYGRFYGSLFSFDPLTGNVEVKILFDGVNGANPTGSLVKAKDGKLYGTTSGGGQKFGTIFRFDPRTDTYESIKELSDPLEGSTPFGNLVESSNGLLYGTTYAGGIYGKGVIFTVEPLSKSYKKLLDVEKDIPSNTPNTAMVEINPSLNNELTYTGPAQGQYSDEIQLTSKLVRTPDGAPLPGRIIHFELGNQKSSAITDEHGIAATKMILFQKPGNYIIKAIFPGDKDFDATAYESGFEIQPENAAIISTGSQFASTLNTGSSKAIVTLSATIKDISVIKADYNDDDQPGDIRRAELSFVDLRDYSIIGRAPIGLVDSKDSTVGTATFLWDVDISVAKEITEYIGVRLEGYYTYWGPFTYVNVSKAVISSLNGGGTISGNDKTQFNINLKHVENEFKGKAGLNHISPASKRFNITDPRFYSFYADGCSSAWVNALADISGLKSSGVSISEKNAVLQWEFNNAEKGKDARIKLTCWSRKGGLIFSSNWGAAGTEWSEFNGNIKINDCGKSLPVKQLRNEGREESFVTKVYPNPSQYSFNIGVPHSFNGIGWIRVTDLSGRIIEERKVSAGSVVQIGEHYQPGIYFAELNHGAQKVVVKLLKTRN